MALTRRGVKHARMLTCFVNDHDFLSNLPKDILLVILDKLPIEEAVATSLLSRRWRDLWKFMSKVDFTYRWVQEVGKEIFPSVNQFVHHHRGQKIRSFRVYLRYNKSMLKAVTSWISFAVEKNVEDLYLDLNDRNDRRKRRNTRVYSYFKLPTCLFSCSSLTRMVLKFLILELPQSIYLRTLRELYLDRTTFANDAIEKLTASCPVLELIMLSDCNTTQDLNINVAPNSSVLKLIIKESFPMVAPTTKIIINAPKATVVEFYSGMPRRNYQIKVPVGVNVRFNFSEMLYKRHVVCVTRLGLTGEQYDRNLPGLLDSFKTAKAIHVCSWSIQVLSLKKLMNQETLSFSLTRLVLDTGLLQWELPGIAYLLKACHQLENLVIIMLPQIAFRFNHAFIRLYYFDVASYWRQQRDICLERLHSVEFKNPLADSLTWIDGIFDTEKFFKRYENGIELFWFLAVNSPNLKRMALNGVVFGTRVTARGCTVLVKK